MSRDEVENCLQNSLVKKNLNIVNKIKEAIEYLERPTDQKIDYWLVTTYLFLRFSVQFLAGLKSKIFLSLGIKIIIHFRIGERRFESFFKQTNAWMYATVKVAAVA